VLILAALAGHGAVPRVGFAELMPLVAAGEVVRVSGDRFARPAGAVELPPHGTGDVLRYGWRADRAPDVAGDLDGLDLEAGGSALRSPEVESTGGLDLPLAPLTAARLEAS
jgi:hypothetical protein